MKQSRVGLFSYGNEFVHSVLEHRCLPIVRRTNRMFSISGARAALRVATESRFKFSQPRTIILISASRNFALPGINIPKRTWRQYVLSFSLGVREGEFVSGPFRETRATISTNKDSFLFLLPFSHATINQRLSFQLFDFRPEANLRSRVS